MDLLKIVYLSLGSLAILFALTKLMGNREMSQLSMFDYIVGITIGSIAAEMATSLENNFWEPAIAMIVYSVVTILISYISCKSIKLRTFFAGKPIILYDNGKLYRKNFSKAKLDINEFLMQCRINGYFNLSDIQTAIIESNGRISFMPVSSKRPATPEDLNLNVSNSFIVSVVIDGAILEEDLKKLGHDKYWLFSQMKKQGTHQVSDIFLATCDTKNNLSIYRKQPSKKRQRDGVFVLGFPGYCS